MGATVSLPNAVEGDEFSPEDHDEEAPLASDKPPRPPWPFLAIMTFLAVAAVASGLIIGSSVSTALGPSVLAMMPRGATEDDTETSAADTTLPPQDDLPPSDVIPRR